MKGFTLTNERILGSILAYLVLASVSLGQNPEWIIYNTVSGLANNIVLGMAIDSHGNKWFGTLGSGVSKFDGAAWVTYTHSNGLPSDTVYSIAIDRHDTIWIATHRGLSKWHNSALVRNYTTVDGLSGNRVLIVKIDVTDRLWCGTDMGISRFDGSTWLNWSDSHFIVSMAFQQNGHKWFGANWSDGLGGYQGGLYHYDDLMNLVAQHTEANTGGGLPSNSVFGIAIDNSGTKWLATFGGAVSFNGTSWTPIDIIPQHFCFRVEIDQQNNKWFTTKDSGVGRYNGVTCDTFNTWNSPLPHNQVLGILIDQQNNKWFLTGGGGVAVYNQGGVVAVDDRSGSRGPAQFALHPNYPNPFNPSTSISYQLPAQCDVTLKVFDVLGREVATPVSGVESPGTKSVNFNAGDLSSGVYFYRLKATTISDPSKSFTQVKKMLLLR